MSAPGVGVQDILRIIIKCKDIYTTFADEYEIAPAVVQELIERVRFLANVLSDVAAIDGGGAGGVPAELHQTFVRTLEECISLVERYRALKSNYLAEHRSASIGTNRPWHVTWQTGRYGFDHKRASDLIKVLDSATSDLLQFVITSLRIRASSLTPLSLPIPGTAASELPEYVSRWTESMFARLPSVSNVGNWVEGESVQLELVDDLNRAGDSTTRAVEPKQPATVSGYTACDSGYVSRTTGTFKHETYAQPPQSPLNIKVPSESRQSTISEEEARPQLSPARMGEGDSEGPEVLSRNDEEPYFGGRYQFSMAGSVSDQCVGQFISEMAQALICALPPRGLDDSNTPLQLAPVLPRILESFALMIGHRAPTATHREVMVFVNRYQSAIIHRFNKIYAGGNDGEEDDYEDRPQTSIDRALQWRPEGMLGRFLSFSGPLEEPAVGETSEGHRDQEHEEDSHNSESADVHEDDSTSNIDIYRECIVKSSAYEWLRGALLAEVTQTPAAFDFRSKLRDKVLSSLNTNRGKQKLSRKMPVEPHRASFEMEWDPRSFVEKQRYAEKRPGDAISKAITLTGSSQDCQATTTGQYLSQTWPLTGSYMMELIQRLLGGEPGERQSATWPDQTTVTVQSNGPKFTATAHGPVPSLAEVAEQLAWLGAALRPSPREQGMWCCIPYIRYLGEGVGSSDPTASIPLSMVESSFSIGFHFDPVPDDDASSANNGRCWHSMFRNPVIVQGYPILRRAADLDYTLPMGIEMSLEMMATLTNSGRLVDFCGTTYLKGFSSMLVATKAGRDIVLWHHLFDLEGRYISYSDSRAVLAARHTTVSLHTIEQSRHIVGWCEKVKHYTGAPDANYDIKWSGLDKANARCAFQNVSVSGGQFVTVGANILLGVRDKPAHVTFGDDYIQMLLVVDDRHFVMYDIDDRRAWLVRGANAVLHIFRAAMREHKNDPRLRRILVYDDDDLVEADDPYAGSAAFEVLSNLEENVELPLYPSPRVIKQEETKNLGKKDTDVTLKATTSFVSLKDRVSEICHILSQIMAHQDNVHSENGVGFRLRTTPRRQLEGFDFMDVAVGRGALWPKVQTLHHMGRGWVDFARAIHAVTLFGKGFGELLQPEVQVGQHQTPQGPKACAACHWQGSLPRGRDYLATSTRSLAEIASRRGDMGSSPWRLVDDIHWFTPEKAFEPCRCSRREQHDRVQVLLPAKLTLTKRHHRLGSPGAGAGAEAIPPDGAVIFGHSKKYPLRWAASGDPVEGEPERDADEDHPGHHRPPFFQHDSGLGTSVETTETSQSSSGGGGLYMHDNQQFVDNGPDVVQLQTVSEVPVHRRRRRSRMRTILNLVVPGGHKTR